AMNDVTRQVAGALGTAIVGSLISTFYVSGLGDSVDSLSAASRDAAEGSIGQANAVAATLPSADAASLTHSAATAYTDALRIAFAVISVCALAGAIAVRRFLPAGEPVETDETP